MLGRPWIIWSAEYTGSSLSSLPTSPMSDGGCVDDVGVDAPSELATKDAERGISGIVQLGPVTYTAISTESDVVCAAERASYRGFEIHAR